MTTTQTLAITRDVADLIDLASYEAGIAPATQAALAEWRGTVTPTTPRAAVVLARRTSSTCNAGAAAPSLLGVAAAASALLAVGAMLVSALGTVAV